MQAKLLDVVDIRCPSRRRQIADRHVLDHSTAQRAHALRHHSEGSCLFALLIRKHNLTGRQPRFTSRQPSFPRGLPPPSMRISAERFSSISIACAELRAGNAGAKTVYESLYQRTRTSDQPEVSDLEPRRVQKLRRGA